MDNSLYPSNDWSAFFADNSKLLDKISSEIQHSSEDMKPLKIFPERTNIFRALNLCPIEKTKVVIIGQDCYHGKDQANGLCFSVNEGVKHPPSLRNILKEIESDLGRSRKNGSDFTDLAEQGVLLLNSALTVVERLAGSNLKIWEPFTDLLIKYISDTSPNKLVFILWGNYAKNKKKFINSRHNIIEGTHPSPLSANRGGFFGGKYFSKANEFLKNNDSDCINWCDYQSTSDK